MGIIGILASFSIRITFWYYFLAARIIFELWNWFTTKTIVGQPTNDLLLISANEAVSLIREGRLSCEDFVKAYIDRIKLVNPAINALTQENFHGAIGKAKAIDQYIESLDRNSNEYKNLHETHPLLGIPFTVKETIFVKGFVSTGGIRAKYNSREPAQDDSEAVKRLVLAGGIFLGQTNVPELGLWWETSNTVFGCTKNPYDSRRTCGGSTGGEGALLGSACSLVGLGNDCAGSLRVPAIFNGVFGLKPSPTLVPSTGSIPRVIDGNMLNMLTFGPMSRYADDLDIMFRVLAGPEAVNRLRMDDPVDFRTIRLFYMEGLNSYVANPVCKESLCAVKRAARYFSKKYDISAHRVDIELAHHAVALWLSSLNENDFENLSELMTNYSDRINYFSEMAKYIIGSILGLKWSDHTVHALLISSSPMSSVFPPNGKFREQVRSFMAGKRNTLRRELIDLLGENGILIFPGWPTLAPFHHQTNTSPFDIIYTALWNVLGLPSLACPMGVDSDRSGLPTGIQIIASPNCERLLLAAAHDLEEGFGGWSAAKRTSWFSRLFE